MPTGRGWSKDELIMAMNLYCKLPFGKLHKGNSTIIRLATAIGRTPSSVAMKLVNFASLDPVQRARGIHGLSAASRADHEVWDAFNADWGRMVYESERLLEIHAPKLATEAAGEVAVSELAAASYAGEVESQAMVKVRRAQGFFRRSVLASYRMRCCITGNPVPELLTASHIAPWAACPDHRTNPRNGLCLARTQDAAFDRGLITLDEQLRVVVSKTAKHHAKEESIAVAILRFEGRKIMLPERFAPQPELLEYHRNNVFRG